MTSNRWLGSALALSVILGATGCGGPMTNDAGTGGGSMASTGGGSATGGGTASTGGGTASTGGGTASTGGGTASTGGGTASTGGGTASTGGGTASTGGGTASTGGGTASTGGGTASTGGGTASTGGGTASTGGGTASTGGGTASTGGGTASTGGGTASTGGGTASTGGGTASTGGGTASTGGGTASTGGGTASTGGGTASTGGGTASTGGGTASTGGGTASTGGGTASTGGGTASTGGGTASTGGGTASTGGGTASTGGGTASTGGGTASTGGGTGTLPDGGLSPSGQIARVIQAAELADGGGLLPQVLDSVMITYVKPLLAAATLADGGSSDPAGYFTQADQQGPAIFVRPAGGNVNAGDIYRGTVQTAIVTNGLHQVTSYSNYQQLSTGNPVGPLIQAVSSVDFNQLANVNAYESEIISLTGTIAGPFNNAGTGYKAAIMTTTGTTLQADGGTNLVFRVPAVLADTEELVKDCTVTLARAPLWRNNAVAQPSIFSAGEMVATCPAPKLTTAIALGPTTIQLGFDRLIGMAPPSAFSVHIGSGPSIAVTQATITQRTVVLTTAALNVGGVYTVDVSNTVLDTRNNPVVAPNNTRNFVAPGAGVCTAALVISAFYTTGGNANATYDSDFVELRNRGTIDIDLNGWSIQYASSGGTNWNVHPLSGVIPAGKYFLVKGQTGTNGNPLPTAADAVASQLGLGGTSGKIALVPSLTPNTGACPLNSSDFVSYGVTGGQTGQCSEGSPTGTTSAPTVTITQAIYRGAMGCADSNSNAADFTAATLNPPRNAASAAPAACVCP